MKVSARWISDYLNFELPKTNELVTAIGAQLGAVEEVVDLAPKYAGAVIVTVVSCSKLENSDHLSLCFIDDGGVVEHVNRREDGLVQVVCGAPNVTAGVQVVWLPPGATVPSTYDTDPFVLEARELRGAVSNGMLASPKELSVGDSHEGLLLLDGSHQPGISFAAAFKLDDQIIDIENKMFTHRPDCFGQLGVAREVAGILGEPFASPDWYVQPPAVTAGSGLPLRLQNELPNEVPRFMLMALKNITIKPSPVWMQTYLNRAGVRPINNVVDITNYMMLLTAQPLHAYDYDKVAALTKGEGAVLGTRYPHQDEQLELLNGKTYTPRTEAILITTDEQAIGMGGVMGGATTEVDEQTKNIILECATFDMYSIRRTSMAHGLFSDAVTRFNKGQSPLQNPAVFAKTIELLQELAGAEPASPVIDDNHAIAQAAVAVDALFINQRLGLTLSAEVMATLLTNVEFEVQVSGDTLTVQPPFWRTDIAIPEDVVEEVGRLHGFDSLPLELPTRDVTPTAQSALLLQKTVVRDSLVKAGANELLTYSFVHGNMLSKATQQPDQAFSLGNALSPDLQYYRLSLLPGLLDKVHPNIKAGHDNFALFELGKAHGINHLDDQGLPIEFEDLDLVYASSKTQPGAAFYRARRYLDALAADLGLQLTYTPLQDSIQDPVTDPYDPARTAQVHTHDGIELGVVGEFKPGVTRSFKLPSYTAGFSIKQKQLLKARQAAPNPYQPLPRFPKVEQDICLKVPATTTYAALTEVVQRALQAAKPEHSKLQVSPLDIYQRQDDPEHKQITYRVSLASFQKTLTDQEMAAILAAVADAAAKTCNAERM